VCVQDFRRLFPVYHAEFETTVVDGEGIAVVETPEAAQQLTVKNEEEFVSDFVWLFAPDEQEAEDGRWRAFEIAYWEGKGEADLAGHLAAVGDKWRALR